VGINGYEFNAGQEDQDHLDAIFLAKFYLEFFLPLGRGHFVSSVGFVLLIKFICQCTGNNLAYFVCLSKIHY
jgi:hypothetical protein